MILKFIVTLSYIFCKIYKLHWQENRLTIKSNWCSSTVSCISWSANKFYRPSYTGRTSPVVSVTLHGAGFWIFLSETKYEIDAFLLIYFVFFFLFKLLPICAFSIFPLLSTNNVFNKLKLLFTKYRTRDIKNNTEKYAYLM